MWYLIYLLFPQLILLGMLGLFGENAKDAAWFYFELYAFILVIIIVIAIIGDILSGFSHS